MTTESGKTTKARRKKPQAAHTKTIIRRPKPGSKAETILTLATTTNHSQADIARIVGADPGTVTQTLNRYNIDRTKLDTFKNHRADILAGLQNKIIERLNIDDIKIDNAKAMQSAITGFGILYDKERVERGLSTTNLDVVHTDIAELKKLQIQKDESNQ